MRVAICFAGMPYYVMQNQGYWLKLKEKYNADVYASLWDEDGVYQEGDTVESFRKVYKPVILEVDNQEHFLSSFRFPCEEYDKSPNFFNTPNHFAHKNGRPYSTYYKIWRANLLTKMSGKDYDIVIRAETCSSYPDLNLEKNESINIPYWHHVYNWGGYHSCNINNWVAYGSPELMDYYCSIFLYLRKYYGECFVQPIESFLNHHLFMRPEISLKFFNSRIFRKGVLNWNGRQDPADYTSEIPRDGFEIKVRDLEKSYNTCIASWGKREEGYEFDLHEMKTPPDVPEGHWTNPKEAGNLEETGYHSLHKFSPEKKAIGDSNCGKVTQDDYGNFIPINNSGASLASIEEESLIQKDPE